jgi:hypothetical protein
MSVEDLTLIENARTVKITQLVLGNLSAPFNYTYTIFFNNGTPSLSGSVSGSAGVSTSFKSICDGLSIDINKVRAVRIRPVTTTFWSEGYNTLTAATTALTADDEYLLAGSVGVFP